MKGIQSSKRGFTLIELIMVMVVLGFLAVAALPKFVNLTTVSRTANRDGTLGAIRAGIATQLASSFALGTSPPVFPTTLDGVASETGAGEACVASNACFDTVIPGGLTDGEWGKAGALEYRHSADTATAFTYNATSGTFL